MIGRHIIVARKSSMVACRLLRAALARDTRHPLLSSHLSHDFRPRAASIPL
jgi:hypothetical protein